MIKVALANFVAPWRARLALFNSLSAALFSLLGPPISIPNDRDEAFLDAGEEVASI